MATKQIVKKEFIKDVNELSYKELTAKYGLNASILRAKIKELGIVKSRPKAINVEWLDDEDVEAAQQEEFNADRIATNYTPEPISPSVFQ